MILYVGIFKFRGTLALKYKETKKLWYGQAQNVAWALSQELKLKHHKKRNITFISKQIIGRSEFIFHPYFTVKLFTNNKSSIFLQIFQRDNPRRKIYIKSPNSGPICPQNITSPWKYLEMNSDEGGSSFLDSRNCDWSLFFLLPNIGICQCSFFISIHDPGQDGSHNQSDVVVLS